MRQRSHLPRSGHLASPAYSAPKILWLRDEQPEIFHATVCFLQPKDYAVFRLTGDLATDYSDASGTLLFDLLTRTWIDDFLVKLELAPVLLPRLFASNQVVGTVTAQAAAATGLAAGTPVVIGGGDGPVPASAPACWSRPGLSKHRLLRVDQHRQQRAGAGSLAADGHLSSHLPGALLPAGPMQAAGGAREWAYGVLAGVMRADSEHHMAWTALDAAAATAALGADGLIFLPHLMGERSPYGNRWHGALSLAWPCPMAALKWPGPCWKGWPSTCA